MVTSRFPTNLQASGVNHRLWRRGWIRCNWHGPPRAKAASSIWGSVRRAETSEADSIPVRVVYVVEGLICCALLDNQCVGGPGHSTCIVVFLLQADISIFPCYFLLSGQSGSTDTHAAILPYDGVRQAVALCGSLFFLSYRGADTPTSPIDPARNTKKQARSADSAQVRPLRIGSVAHGVP